jgi:hypothetical protein
MNNSGQDNFAPLSFYERYSGYSDNQIKEILINRKNYQEPAVTAAVKIAIERELIHSEQDLFASEYQSKPSSRTSIFPEITNVYQYKKLVASIFRILFFLSFIPTVFGVLKYAEGQLNMTFLGVGLGFIWLILTYVLLKTRKLNVLYLQVCLLGFVFLGLVYRLFLQKPFHIADMAILVIGTLLPFYFLLYLMKLIQTKPDSLSGI